jgi:hypothetical protein
VPFSILILRKKMAQASNNKDCTLKEVYFIRNGILKEMVKEAG